MARYREAAPAGVRPLSGLRATSLHFNGVEHDS